MATLVKADINGQNNSPGSPSSVKGLRTVNEEL